MYKSPSVGRSGLCKLSLLRDCSKLCASWSSSRACVKSRCSDTWRVVGVKGEANAYYCRATLTPLIVVPSKAPLQSCLAREPCVELAPHFKGSMLLTRPSIKI